MDLHLHGHHALVVGAAGGLGQSVCRGLMAEGTAVTMADLHPPAASPTDTLFLPIDLRSESSVRAAVRSAEERQPLDFLINCAGIFSHAALLEMTLAQWQDTIDINLSGVFVACQEALRVMMPRGHGVIVNVASLAGQVGGLVAGADYVSSKAGLIGFSKSLARLAGPRGIRVNVVNPGIVKTPMTADWSPETLSKLKATTPLGRLAEPEEVGQVVTLLCSDAMSFVHGTHIDINGGLYLD